MRSSETICLYAPVPTQLHAELVGRWETLCSRDDLSRDAWDLAWASGPSASLACVLLDRDLDADQLATVARSEKRQGPLSMLVRMHWDALDDDSRTLVASRAKGELAASLMDRCTGGTRVVLSQRLDGNRRLDWLASSTPDEVDDDELVGHLAGVGSWVTDTGARGARSRNTAVESLCHHRPVALAPLVEHLPGFAYAPVAGALTLWDPELQAVACARIVDENQKYAAMALAANPVRTDATVASLRAWAVANRAADVMSLLDRDLVRVEGNPLECDNPEVFRRLVRRTNPGERRPQGRYAQMVYLCDAELVGEVLDDVVERLGRSTGWEGERALARLAVRFAGGEGRTAALLAPYAPDGDGTGGPLTYRSQMDQARRADRPTSPPAVVAVDDTGAWRTLRSHDLASWSRSSSWGRQHDQLHARRRATLVPMAAEMGDAAAPWELLLTLVDDFPGTLGELVEIALATTE